MKEKRQTNPNKCQVNLYLDRHDWEVFNKYKPRWISASAFVGEFMREKIFEWEYQAEKQNAETEGTKE